jgi:hypothetical protein
VIKLGTLFILIVFIVGCSSEEKPVNQLLLPNKGFKFQLVQRTQINLPSVEGNVICSINDITKGQTQIIIKENEKVLVAESIMEMEPINFKFNGFSYTITCKHMVNKLFGDDYANFEIVENIHPQKAEKDETKEIEALLKKIETSDIIFVRNGEEHSPKEAADHLRSKWEQSGGKIKTKQAFIDHLATKSSTTGELYYVILKDGNKLQASVWLKKQ